MSNLLSQASLVMIPSGYKEDVVYSQIPTSGAGDLSFTRASNGTRINSAGLVEDCPWNLLQNSENFSIDFIQINASISNNTTTAPNGTTTADSLIENTATDNHFAFGDSTQQSGTQYTYSVYAKSIGGRNIRISGSSGYGGAIIVDLSNGSVLSGSGVVENVGNGWYRISITATTTTSTVRVIIYAANGTSLSYTGNGTSGVYLWGGQLNIGSTAKPYFPTTDRLNVPRLTYQNGGGGCPSLLLEKQSTNELSYSEQLDNADWSVKDNVSVTANATTSPDGTINADKLVEDSSNNQHRVYRTIDGTNKSFSFFAKAGERSWLAALSNDGNFTYFDIANGVLGTVASGSTASITAFGNGWFRCVLYNAHGTYGALIQLALANNGTSYQGNGTSGAFVWGCQMEASSYPTSYIPTTSASATRVADACYKTGISSLIGQTEGVLFADVNRIQKSQNYNVAIFIGLWPSVIDVYFDNSNQIICIVYVSGVLQTTLNGGVLANGRHKIAVAYKQNDFVMYVDGAQVATSSSGSVPTCSQLIIGNDDSTLYHLNDSINEAVIFPTRLTNAELASLTTI